MHSVIARYVPGARPRSGRIPCPVHGGKNYNFGYDENVYHCFVCGCKGDLIQFVQDMFEIDFAGAIRKIDSDFELNLPIDRKPTLREKRAAQQGQMERLERKRKEEAEKKAYDDLYWTLWDEWSRLEGNRFQYAPKHPDDEPHPLFVEALHKIDYIQYLIDILL